MRLPALVRAASVLALLVVSAGHALPPATPGEPSLHNLAHVYHFDISGAPATDKGTEVEFFASTVPLRDYSTGESILDADGAAIVAQRDFVVMGTYGAAPDGLQHRGAFLFDITDPERIELAARIPCPQFQSDVQVKQFGDRWVLAITHDDGHGPLCLPAKVGPRSAGGISLFDVTDPFLWSPMYSIGVSDGAHNFTFHPTKPFGWVSSGELPGGRSRLPIIDFSNLESPTVDTSLVSIGGPHDIAFDASGDRAYVAAENNLRIYDSTNPRAPELVTVTRNATTYVHDAAPSPDGRLLVATGESLALGGFFHPGTAVCPGEGLTVYSMDRTRERAPVPVGYYAPNVVGRGSDVRACTAHNGRWASPTVYVMAWFLGGVRVVDLSNPSVPKEIGHAVMPGGEPWSARPYKGYIYAGDQARGLDVFRWTGPPW